jgi:hypothetical protein
MYRNNNQGNKGTHNLENLTNLGGNRPKPDPSRFEKFDLLDDESGFTLQGCDFTFYFDKRGGW